MRNAGASSQRGHLRIFLGYATGVGKTYAMLEAAHRRRSDGEDVVVAYVETHNRPETEALLAGLELIPRQEIGTEGLSAEEMDLDAVLARQPQLALVDDLAHTNAPGLRHPKRYQDVEELLRAGIDVYTTLNVENLESLKDVVAQITGVDILETVPDRVLEEADIRLLDLPVEELLRRLEEGKIYIPPQQEEAMHDFFRPGNLTALRELALRSAARCVDGQMRAYMQSHAIPGPWPAADRLLVCVGTSSLSERLVRTASRLASKLDAEWFALHVAAPATEQLTPAEQTRVARTLRLAEDLGAQAVTLSGDSVAETVSAYVQNHNITKIVLGKPLRAHWLEWLHPSPLEGIIRSSPGVDVYVISGNAVGDLLGRPTHKGGWLPLPAVVWSVLAVLVATGVGLLARAYIEPTNLVMLYLLAVVVSAVRAGRRSAILASLFSVLAFDFIFVPPYYTFAVTDAEYVLSFLGLLLVGITISTLTARAREQAKAALYREAQTNSLYKLGRDLTAAADLATVGEVVLNRLQQTFGLTPVWGLPDAEGTIRTVGRNATALSLDPHERDVVNWVYQQGQPAGAGTETLGDAELYVVPLDSGNRILGVLGLRCAEKAERLSAEQRRLFESFARQAALAVDRVQLSDEAREAQVLRETEKFQTALINTISRDLRTPLAAITDSLEHLHEEDAFTDASTRRSLLDAASAGADRLNTLVDNLLHISQLEAGALRVLQERGTIEEIVETALAQLAHRLEGHSIEVDVPPGLPPISIDTELVVQALINLIDNAVKYSDHELPIQIRARLLEGEIAVDVLDRGPGIPSEDLQRIFDKFYRIPRDQATGGSGLGLSISRGIAEAHGGRLWVINRAGGGAVFRMTLPIASHQTSIVELAQLRA